MSYKLGDTPTANPTNSELADFLEIECLKSYEHSFSITEAAQLMGIIDDESTPANEEEENLDSLKEALGLIEDRKRWTKNYYPFVAGSTSVGINEDCDDLHRILYTFLLLATRERMSVNRLVGEIDGALLFERLGSYILRNFFGNHSKSFVFGTGCNVNESFLDKLRRMFNEFNEKGYSVTNHPINSHRKDGGIDIVTYIPFEDQRQGHFVAFAQCKTGTSWEQYLSSLQPTILDDYIQPSLVSKPYILFLIADDCQKDDWNTKVRSTQGIIFDRCRIMSYIPQDIDRNLLQEISTWNNAVLQRYP